MIVYVYRWKESLNMCLAYEIHLSCHIDKYQIKKHYLEINKKYWDKSKKYPISFELSRWKAYICFAFRGKSSLTITLHHFDTYAIPLRHKLCTTRTNDLHRFHCIPVRRASRRIYNSTKVKLSFMVFSLLIIHFIIQFLQGESFNFSTFRHFDI